MRNIWFTSDLHLGHARIIELCKRPFADVDEMNNVIIKRWNNVVQPDDTVYVLGDVALGTITESLALVTQLTGNKLLVPGNHDRVFSAYRKGGPRPQDVQIYKDAGFTILPERIRVLRGESHPYEEAYLLCHFPYAGDSHENDRYVEHRPPDKGNWLIHGHVHERWQVNGRQINVGVDVWDFAPVPITKIREIVKRSEPK